MTPHEQAAKPLTAADLAEALSCFWNAAIGEARRQQEGMAFASIMAEGVSAVMHRLNEITDPAEPLLAPDAASLAAEWQPIDTAPKDGTAVLLFFAMRAAEYDKRSGEQLEPYRLQALSVEVGFFQGGEWCEAGTGHDFFEEWRRSDYPTHWMPLPATPDTALTPTSKGSPK